MGPRICGTKLLVAFFLMTLSLISNVAKVVGQGSAYLTGFVQDPSGAGVPGATVVIKNMKTGTEYSAKTTDTGVYRSAALPSGSYDVTVQANGFKSYVGRGVEIQLGQARGLDITLEVGEISQEIEVTAAAPALKTEDAGLGQNVTYAEVQSLPKFSRSAGSLLALAPGVRFTADDVISYGSSRYNIGGNSNATVMVDGASVMTDREDIAQMGLNPSAETLQEVKIVVNQYGAEFGHDIGSLVQYETKAGTNAYHGGVYEYFRNDALDTASGFTRTKAPDKQHMFGGTLGGPIKKDKFFFFSSLEVHLATTPSSYLLTVPTAAMKTGDFSGLRNASGDLIPIYDPATTRTDPATGRVVRDPFPGNIIPANRLDRAALLAAEYIPNPSLPQLVNNLPSPSARDFRKIKGTEKFDWNISDKDRFMASWMFDWTQNTDQGIAAYNAIAPQMSPRPGEPGFKFGTQVYNFRFVHTFSPTTFISTQWNYRPRHIERQNAGIDPEGKWATKLGIKNFAGARLPEELGGDLGTPGYNFAGYTNLGSGFLQFKENPISVFEWNVDLTYIRGRHSYKVGFSTERGLHAAPDQSFPTGNFGFTRLQTSQPFNTSGGDAFASFLLGLVNNANTSLGPLISGSNRYYAMYIQDDWKVRPGLTFNFGLRWDIDAPLYEKENQGNSFDFLQINPVSGTPGVAKFLDTPGYPYKSYFDTSWNRFAPRFGFAWQVQTRTVVRGGYGIFNQSPYLGAHHGISLGYTTSASFTSPDGGISPAFILQNGFPDYPLGGDKSKLNDSFGSVPVGQIPSTSPSFVSRRWKFGTTQNFNLSVQHEMPWNMLFEVAGQGVLGRNQSINRNWNEVSPQLWGRTGANNARRPYPQFGNVTQLRSQEGTTDYFGTYVRLDKRFSHGLTLIANYSYGRTIGFTGGSVYFPRLSRGPTQYDLANGLGRAVPYQLSTVGWAYDLPWGPGKPRLNSGVAAKILGGWNFGGLLALHGGIPFEISSGADSLNANSPLGGRVNLVGNPKLDNPTPDRWFNTQAFADPTFGTVGNFCCGKLLGPANRRLDVSISKTTMLKENLRFVLAGEFFNFTNTPQFGPPDGNMRSPNFGRTLGPAGLGAGIVVAPHMGARIVQIGARIEF